MLIGFTIQAENESIWRQCRPLFRRLMGLVWSTGHPPPSCFFLLSTLLQDCIFLFKEYQASFHKTRKQILESSGEKSFEVSEMYIFGKFEAFCKRLEKVSIRQLQDPILACVVLVFGGFQAVWVKIMVSLGLFLVLIQLIQLGYSCITAIFETIFFFLFFPIPG